MNADSFQMPSVASALRSLRAGMKESATDTVSCLFMNSSSWQTLRCTAPHIYYSLNINFGAEMLPMQSLSEWKSGAVYLAAFGKSVK